jgi:hypothetical protein
MSKQQTDLSKMQNLLATKASPVVPASDAVQRGFETVPITKDEKTKSSKDEIVNLSFKVPSEFRKRFKLAAVNTGITQNELVMRALEAWEERKV